MSLLEQCIIPEWPAPKNVRALQTTRNGGTSAAPYDSFNLSSYVGDDPVAVTRNRELLQTLLPGEPLWLQQVHGITVADADHATQPVKADASISSQPGSVCVAMTADCLPVLLCNDRGSVVSAVHAGWRGLCDGVIEQAAYAMNEPGHALMAWMGPAIGANAFEVGDEVRAEFIARNPQAVAAFRQSLPGKWLADIYHLARLRLSDLGITRVYGGGLCTYTDSKKFFSFRRDNVTGRMGTFIWLEQ